jgi:DMSO/TMAO reductase YedYZ molybdopterin-dependent catalytic subunit
MNVNDVDRRTVLTHGTGAVAGLGFLHTPFIARAFARDGEEVLPWADRLPENPIPHILRNQLDWEEFESWITPFDQFFEVSHFGHPDIDEADWRLRVGGMVREPMELSLDDIRARPRQEVVFAVECAGNHGLPFANGMVGNARWAGTPLRPILEEAGIEDGAIDVVFFAHDHGPQEFHGVEYDERFARAMSVEDAMDPTVLLAYEMNGESLPRNHGYPLRVIAPGWYGVANVKWLDRIDVRPTRYMGFFMAHNYVALRQEEIDGERVWTRNSVGPARLKSVPGRVTLANGAHRIVGAAWGAPIERVEVRIDDGEWREADLLAQEEESEHAWVIWSLDWEDAEPGEHAVTARATDRDGNVQPTPDDPMIADKHTYWEDNAQVTRRIVIR